MIDIEKELPEFYAICNSDENIDIVLSHRAFGNEENELLGAAIQYACSKGKNVTIVGNSTDLAEQIELEAVAGGIIGTENVLKPR